MASSMAFPPVGYIRTREKQVSKGCTRDKIKGEAFMMLADPLLFNNNKIGEATPTKGCDFESSRQFLVYHGTF